MIISILKEMHHTEFRQQTFFTEYLFYKMYVKRQKKLWQIFQNSEKRWNRGKNDNNGSKK